ncbi:MAG TPA: hypothetical protein VKA51_04005 [Rubrobacteraceae bacterium]|nr:hypothetical protein [Rubrobacteraceae bacterium]
MDGAGRDLAWKLATVVAGAAAFVVVVAAVVGPDAFWGPGRPGTQDEAPGTYSRVLITYEKRVSGNPGLSYTETFATLGCDPGDQLLSGGFSGLDEGTVVITSEPDTVSSAEAWLVGWENDASPDAVNVAVLCAEAAFPPHEE